MIRPIPLPENTATILRRVRPCGNMTERGTSLRACAEELSRTKIPFFALAPRRGSVDRFAVTHTADRAELGGASARDAGEDIEWPQPAALAKSNERKRSASRSEEQCLFIFVSKAPCGAGPPAGKPAGAA